MNKTPPANSTWAEGDWNGDGLFDPQDIVTALRAGTYLQGPQAARAEDLADKIFAESGQG